MKAGLSIAPAEERVLIGDLAKKLGVTDSEALGKQLVQMQRAGQLVLYRNDHSKSAEHQMSITVGDSPRHIVYFTPPKPPRQRNRE